MGAIALATEAFLVELARGDSALAARLADPLRLYVEAADREPRKRGG